MFIELLPSNGCLRQLSSHHIIIFKFVDEHKIFIIMTLPAAVGNVHSDKQVPVPVQTLLRGDDESQEKTIHPQL